MTRAIGVSLALVLVWTAHPGSVRQTVPPPAASSLVGTWTLTTLQQSTVSGGPPAHVANPRGLLVLDGAGHAFEFVTSAAAQRVAGGQVPVAEAPAAFASYGGFWGPYRTDMAQRTMTFRPESGVHPQIGGTEIIRSFELNENRLTLTTTSERHTPSGTQWVWDRVPVIDNLSPLYRNVVGFWRHIVEKRVNPTTGTIGSETKRSPSVIVYTPSGFVGVHFPPLNRKPFSGETPTPEEAQAALRGYIGYYGALTVYPGQVFHNILAGVSPISGSILRRSAVISGDELTVQLPATRNQQGEDAQTIVILKRLSGEAEMLPRP
jgi:Lipocalin-like domain